MFVVPELCYQEDIFPADHADTNATSHGFFGPVHTSSVDVSTTRRESCLNCLCLRFLVLPGSEFNCSCRRNAND
jgi:hypothetical protein